MFEIPLEPWQVPKNLIPRFIAIWLQFQSPLPFIMRKTLKETSYHMIRPMPSSDDQFALSESQRTSTGVFSGFVPTGNSSPFLGHSPLASGAPNSWRVPAECNQASIGGRAPPQHFQLSLSFCKVRVPPSTHICIRLLDPCFKTGLRKLCSRRTTIAACHPVIIPTWLPFTLKLQPDIPPPQATPSPGLHLSFARSVDNLKWDTNIQIPLPRTKHRKRLYCFKVHDQMPLLKKQHSRPQGRQVKNWADKKNAQTLWKPQPAAVAWHLRSAPVLHECEENGSILSGHWSKNNICMLQPIYPPNSFTDCFVKVPFYFPTWNLFAVSLIIV